MKQVRLSKGIFALVNDEDYEFVMQWKWYASCESRGTKHYAIRREKGKKIRMHRANVIRKMQLEVITQEENMRRSAGWKKKGMKLKRKTT